MDMISKAEEIEFYGTIYLLAFGKDSAFFYDNDCGIICKLLIDNYFGDNLVSRINLLSKLLYFDSFVNPEIKADLIQKSKEVLDYFNQNPK
jgi:hypothetical protein